MNFFGHAIVAAHKEAHPRFVLGSMLPDLASMLRLRVPAVSERHLHEGVRFHHQTDRAFHDSTSFQTLNREALRRLRDLGVRRGTMRAVAHVGVEYMIDAELAQLFEHHVPAYQRALLEGSETPHLIAWTEDGDRQRFLRLCDDLGNLGVAVFTAGENGIVRRLGRALKNRPQLAIEDRDLPSIARWVREYSGPVATEMPALLAELSGALDLHLAQRQIH